MDRRTPVPPVDGRSRRIRTVVFAAMVSAVVLLAMFSYGVISSRRDPVVREAQIAVPNWPTSEPSVRVVLLADFHLGNASTDAARLKRVSNLVMGLHPDLILLAGDYVASSSREGSSAELPGLRTSLSRLRAPLGVIAVFGNHDNDSDPTGIGKMLRALGFVVLENQAVRRGALVIGGAGDTNSGRTKSFRLWQAMRRAAAGKTSFNILLAHSPDIAKWRPPWPALILAGHTHCGQVSIWPLSQLFPVSRIYGNRFRCGVGRIGADTVIVTAGIGTSKIPLRFGAPPDLWSLSIRPARPEQPSNASFSGGELSIWREHRRM